MAPSSSTFSWIPSEGDVKRESGQGTHSNMIGEVLPHSM